MRGLSFEVQNPVREGSPNRMDIACFVGLVDIRAESARDDIESWLYRQSWLDDTRRGFRATYHRDEAAELLDVPVPIESWERFTQLFDWNRRQWSQDVSGAGYLATAVRSFFAQGGRKCYIVRVDAPLPLDASETSRQQALLKLVPGLDGTASADPDDRGSWRGAGHILGLPDVTILCLPDLPDLARAQVGEISPEVDAAPTPPEQFVVCSQPAAAAPVDSAVTRLPAPRCDLPAFRRWAQVINRLGGFIARHRPDVQLIAALPLADETAPGLHDPLRLMHDESWLDGGLENGTSIASAFVQLVYPWLRSPASELLPERLEPPDGALAGMLARNAITRGAFRSLTGLRQTDLRDIRPRLSQAQMFAAYDRAGTGASPNAALIDRVSLFGFGNEGIEVLSDVTSSNADAHRPANVNRIISMVRRSAQKAGEEYLFENNGERLWAALTQRLNDVLRVLYDLGALRGKTPEDAFFVRCDRSTMSQQDLDQGRVVALVQFEPAASIESIEVVLSMRQNGTVSLQTIGIEQAVA